jgi:uridine phosphorylase
MFAARPERERAVKVRLTALASLGVVAVDMETSAVLAVAGHLGVAAGSLCLATVDGHERARLDGQARSEAEERLVRNTLRTLQIPFDSFDRAVREQAHAVREEV